MTVAAPGRVELKYNGQTVESGSAMWATGLTKTLSSACGVLAIYTDARGTVDDYQHGVLVSTSTGVVSDDTNWKCTNSYWTGMNSPTYDYSHWDQPTVLGANDGSYATVVTSVSAQANWIWTGTTSTVHCRITFC